MSYITPCSAVVALTILTLMGSAWKRENILRQGYLLTSKVSATTLIAAAVVFLRPKPNDYGHHADYVYESKQNHKRAA